MSIRKLNNYFDVSRFDNDLTPTITQPSNVVSPIQESNNTYALSKISESNNLPLWKGSAWPVTVPAGVSEAPSDGKQYARKNAAWSEVITTVGSSSTSGSNLMVEYIVPATCQEFTLSNLDSNSWAGMYVELMLVRPVTGQIGIDMYINSDETYSKYAFKLITFGTSSGSPSVYGSSGSFGSAQIYTDGAPNGNVNTIGGCMIDIMHLNDTVGYISRQILSPIGYYQQAEVKYVNTAIIDNITSLKFKAYSAGNIGAGTRVRVYSKKASVVSPAIQSSLTNVVSTYTVSSETNTITIPNLNSIIDGGYEIELQSNNAQGGSVYCFVNGDTTLTNYYSEALIGYQSTATTSATQNSPAVCEMDTGTYTRCRINLNVDTFGYLRGDSIAFRDYSNAHISVAGFKKIATIQSINSITLTHSVAGGFGIGTQVTIRKRNVNISPDQMASVVDLTSASADYTLQLGQTAKITYTSATTVPLHISTVEGLYEIKISGDRSASPPLDDSATFLKPNNTTVTNITRQQLYALSSSNTTYAYTGTTDTAFEIGEGIIGFSKITLSTFTKNKSVSCDMQCVLSTSSNKLINHLEAFWSDTATAWTSLGTISFPFAQSGTIFIKRIA